MVLFIRVELLSLAVETEGLVEKPGAALHIGKTEFLKRLVPCAGEFLSIFQHCSEAELARLGGVDVKKGDRITEDIPGFPVGYRIRRICVPIRSQNFSEESGGRAS